MAVGPAVRPPGRRRTLICASALVVPPTVPAGLAPSFEVLLACRALQGFIVPGLLTVGPLYVMEVFGPRLGGRRWATTSPRWSPAGSSGASAWRSPPPRRAGARRFSAYYAAGAAGGYLPGLAWEAWSWPGALAVALAGLMPALALLAAHRTPARVRAAA